jgi:NADPH:quinone reductase-like Zn-dependent oxidoreductase
MKAAVLERRGADGVTWRDFPDPKPSEGESVLRVAAGSVNRVDLYMRDNGAGITHVLPQGWASKPPALSPKPDPAAG